MNEPTPFQVLQTMVGLQALTLGFLIGSQIITNRRLRLLSSQRVVVNVTKAASDA